MGYGYFKNMEKWYLDIGNAKDEIIKSPRDRAIYRFLEMLPGILAWGTLVFVILMSRLAPVFIAFFIIAFDIYWLLKTVYLINAHVEQLMARCENI